MTVSGSNSVRSASAPAWTRPLAASLRGHLLQPLRRQEGHLAQGVHQRQGTAVADVVAEDAGEGAGAAGVGAALGEGDAVAGRDDVGLGDDPLVGGLGAARG